MNKILYFLLSLSCINLHAAEGKEDKIEQSHQLQKPLSDWVIIEPVYGEHVIRAASSYLWSYNNQYDNVYLNSAGEINPIVKGDKLNPTGKLGLAYVEKKHTYQIDNYNKFLSQALGVSVKFKDVYTLRIFSESFAYDLAMYANDGELKYIRVCINHCHKIEPDIIDVKISTKVN